MKKLTITFFCLTFVLLFSAENYGQNEISPEKRQLIAELIVLTKTNKQVSEITDIMLTSMETPYLLGFNQTVDKRTDLSQVEKDRLKASNKESYLSFSKRFRERLPQAVNYTKYVEDTIYPLYDKFYTTDEIKDLVAFYKTPTGQKVIGTMPLLFKESSELAQKNLMPSVLKLLDELLQEDLENIGKRKNSTK